MAPLLEVRDLAKSFPSGTGRLHVLRGVSFDVAAGEMTAVVGPSGAGKSTLLHLLGGLDRPDGGTVRYNGREVFGGGSALDRYRNREVGFIFQFHHLLAEFSALENVMMPLLVGRTGRAEALRRATELLVEVGLADRLEHRPGQLSGGEQQRVAAARALVTGPSLILADEPTGNLDLENSRLVFKLLGDLARARALAVVMVTHNGELAAATDRILTLVDGRLTSDLPSA